MKRSTLKRGKPSGYPWREPAEESVGLYPGLVVHDGRVSGSITVGPTRLPVWAFVYELVADRERWKHMAEDYPSMEGMTAEQFGAFLVNLMELRGEFGRLLLVLADAERTERNRGINGTPWWVTKRHRKRVGDQLRRCLDVLEGP